MPELKSPFTSSAVSVTISGSMTPFQICFSSVFTGKPRLHSLGINSWEARIGYRKFKVPYSNFFHLETSRESTRGFSEQTKGPIRSPITWKSMAAALLAGVGLLAYFKMEQRKHENLRKQTYTVGKPDLGGPFSLINQHGLPVTDQDFLGQFLILYFGFTHCPDICPGELTKIADALEILRKKHQCNAPISALFITVDPRRDSVNKIRDYVRQFHPNMIGLTGTPQQVARVAKEYRVYFNTLSQMRSDEGETDYLIDHSIISYFVDPRGQFIDYFGQNVSAEEMAERMKAHITNIENEK